MSVCIIAANALRAWRSPVRVRGRYCEHRHGNSAACTVPGRAEHRPELYTPYPASRRHPQAHLCMCVQCTSHQLHLMFVCHAIAAATGRSRRAHRARAATGTRARAATGMGHRPRDDRRTRSQGHRRTRSHATGRSAAAGAGRRGRAQGQGAGAGCSGRVQRQSAAAGRSGEQWRRDGCVCHVTAALVRAQPQEHRAQGGCTGMRASGAGAHLRTVERPSRRSRRSARRRHRRSPGPGPLRLEFQKLPVGSGWQEKKKVEHEPRPGGWAPQPDEREQGAAVISACTPPRAWARADAVPRVPAVPADGPRACARSPALPPSRARYHQLWCEYRVHLLNSHVFGAAAIAEGTDVRRRCLRPRAGGAPLPAPCALRAAATCAPPPGADLLPASRAGDGHQGQGAKGKGEARVSRGAPGRVQPRRRLMHAWRARGEGLTRGGAGGRISRSRPAHSPLMCPRQTPSLAETWGRTCRRAVAGSARAATW